MRVLPLQEGLGLAVSDLLSPVRLHRWATMVPDDRRRAEADPVAPLEQAPADVHVVRRFLEDRVEPADFLQSALPERHVAARDVLGRSIVEHYLRRAARRSVDALRDPAVFRWHQVRPADADDVGFQKGRGQVGQPVRIGPSVRVDVRDDLPGGGPQPLVAGGAHAAVGRGNRAERIPPDDVRGPVRGPIVDDDDLVVRIIELH